MIDLGLATQTLFAELLQRCLDADFDDSFSERGTFVRRKRQSRMYWYHRQREGQSHKEVYVGPVTDKSITDRVNRFADIKSDFKQRQEMVRALVATGLPTPDPIAGPVIEAMWKAGFFRLRGLLVGTLAYQAYAGPLGIKLGGRPLHTEDVDFAQVWGISENIGDSMPPILTVLRTVDPSFNEIPNLNDPFVATAYRSSRKYKVEFLTPNRGGDEHQKKPAKMKALGGSGAQPLRHLDYLIHGPERSVLLYKGGVPVTVPRAERYAVHKLIVSVERDNQVKSRKDTVQAATLIQALSTRRPLELADAWQTAWDTDPRWKEKLEAGRARLEQGPQDALDGVLRKATESRRRRGSTR
jgi:hypothetical protein